MKSLFLAVNCDMLHLAPMAYAMGLYGVAFKTKEEEKNHV